MHLFCDYGCSIEIVIVSVVLVIVRETAKWKDMTKMGRVMCHLMHVCTRIVRQISMNELNEICIDKQQIMLYFCSFGDLTGRPR